MIDNIISTTIVILYLLNIYFSYMWVRKAYSKGGICETSNIDSFDVLLVFTPLFHLGYSLGYLFGTYKKHNDTSNKFFKIKK